MGWLRNWTVVTREGQRSVRAHIEHEHKLLEEASAYCHKCKQFKVNCNGEKLYLEELKQTKPLENRFAIKCDHYRPSGAKLEQARSR